MILEMRTYTLRPGNQPAYWQSYRDGGLSRMGPVLPNLLGYFVTDIGPLNRVVHLWRYDDLSDRAAKRAAMAADPEWAAHLARIRPLMREQETAILVPSPVPELSPLAAPRSP